MEKMRPSWDDSFMFSALWSAARASCKHLSTGAVIVKDKRILSSGYNGAPPGIKNCLEAGCRKEREGIAFDDKGKGVCRGVHAEINAMNQIKREDLKGTTLYTLFFPCSACAKAIVGAGIKEVVYSKMYAEPDTLAQELFQEAGVILRKLDIDMNKSINMLNQSINQKSV